MSNRVTEVCAELVSGMQLRVPEGNHNTVEGNHLDCTVPIPKAYSIKHTYTSLAVN